MKPDEAAKTLLTTTNRLRLDDAVIHVNAERRINVRGSLWRDAKKEQFHLHLTLPNGIVLDNNRSRIITPEQFWKIEGRLENEIWFHCRDFPSGSNSSWNRIDGESPETIQFTPHQISLVREYTEEIERQRIERRQETFQLLDKVAAKREASGPSAKPTERDPIGYWSASVMIPGVKVIFKNETTTITEKNPLFGERGRKPGDTLVGKRDGCIYGILQHEDSAEVVFQEQGADHRSQSLEDFEERLQSLLRALAFVNGWEPWWQRRTIKRGSDVVLDELRPLGQAPVSELAPLSERACHFGANIIGLINCAWDFFRSDPGSETISRILHLIRQATQKGTPLAIGLLAQCTLLEGVIEVLHARLDPPAKGFTDGVFAALTGHLLDKLAQAHPSVMPEMPTPEQSAALVEAKTRLANFVGSARLLRPEDKLRRVAAHFGLSDAGFVAPLLKEWKAHRNPLAHGSEKKGAPGETMMAYSRIAGALYILVAKSMRYSGRIVASRFEDRDAQI